MKATNLWIRTTPFLLALVLGLLNWTVDPVSSQLETGSALAPYSVSAFTLAAVPLSTAGLGHIDRQAIVRIPSAGWAGRVAEDKIVFAGDIGGGLAVHISDAEVHDRWTWRYYDPDGVLYSDSCFMEIREPGELGNDSIWIALVTNCPTDPYDEWETLEVFPEGCPCTSSYLWTLGIVIVYVFSENESFPGVF
jgi:hypothetical protein